LWQIELASCALQVGQAKLLRKSLKIHSQRECFPIKVFALAELVPVMEKVDAAYFALKSMCKLAA
jgi:hypothetical protein